MLYFSYADVVFIRVVFTKINQSSEKVHTVKLRKRLVHHRV